MANEIALALAEGFVKRLASAALDEIGRIYRVREELKKLEKTVESLRVLLLDAEDKQQKDRALSNWIKRLKDVLHPAEDLLDELVVEDMTRKAKGEKNKIQDVALRHKMANQIVSIQRSINDLVEEMRGLQLRTNVVVSNQSEGFKRETLSFILESNVVGRERDKGNIVRMLMQQHSGQDISSVAIMGFGGIGKTTLAQLAYNDVEVRKHFEKRIWVCVSHDFDVKTIVRKMLVSLKAWKADDDLQLDDMRTKLQQILADQRYLLVLDDIWNENHKKWDDLKSLLIGGATDSKVLVTTRSGVVARTMGCNPYQLNVLTPNESWTLFEKLVSVDGTFMMNEKLKSIGREITEKCKGVPLAIKSVGDLLRHRWEEKVWNGVLHGDSWKLSEDEDGIMSVLKLSYQALSPELKRCFAFCSLYPRGWMINKEELIQMWMANGYLNCSNETHMKRVGDEFVEILFMKYFFQDAKLNEDHECVAFTMHDMIHDLAKEVAGSDYLYLGNHAIMLERTPMHVWVELDAISLLSKLDPSRLRTLIIADPSQYRLHSFDFHEGNEDCWSVISKFKYLRVLDVSDSPSVKLFRLIAKLNHLRYLCLRRCKEQRSGLSKSISNLVCLQTLLLDCGGKVEFSISKLINLRHLCISHWEASRDMKAAVHGKLSVSNWFCLVRKIVQIDLIDCPSLQYLPPLECLPFLESLRLCRLHELEGICYEEPLLLKTFFPSLKTLKLQFCSKLRGWCSMRDDDDRNSSQSHHSSFPFFLNLSVLEMEGCPLLTQMPTFPKLDKRLKLHCAVETLAATLKLVPYSLFSPPLSMLESLDIGGLEMDVGKIPLDWGWSIASLLHLRIGPFTPQQLRAIESRFSNKLIFLPSLRTLLFCNCDGMRELPNLNCHFPKLERMRLWDCPDLESLGIIDVSRVKTMEVTRCPLMVQEALRFWSERNERGEVERDMRSELTFERRDG